jgi:hypothetical protein
MHAADPAAPAAPAPPVVIRGEANYIPPENPGPLEGFARRVLLQDPRDWPLLVLNVQISAVLVPFAVYLFLPGAFRWWLAAIYLALVFGVFVDRYILMLHNASHRPLFKARFRWLNHWIVWLHGPLMGETPETYAAHHIGMHHIEGNLAPDLSSTMRYQRDNILHFAHYYLRFVTVGIVELSAYFVKRKRYQRLRRMLAGELLFYVLIGTLGALVSWPATLVVFVVPFVVVRFLMMCGNWGQHAFVDAATPESSYRNSITCIHTRYNRRAFNDGYHIGHHLRAAMHWTEMPGEFQKNLAKYAEERALVFEGIDFFQVWALLMLRQHRSLAERLVSLDGVTRSLDERVALLRERLRPIPAGAGAAQPAE